MGLFHFLLLEISTLPKCCSIVKYIRLHGYECNFMDFPIINIFCCVVMRHQNYLTNLCIASYEKNFGKSADPDQAPQNGASDQGLHCLH